MSVIANAADRLLGAIVPRATAVAFVCPPGCYRYTDACYPHLGGFYWYDCCKVTATGKDCNHCGFTAYTC
jgi:hypothetical protein